MRIRDDDHRLHVRLNGAGPVMLQATEVLAPGYYGLHMFSFPGDAQMQRLFESTPLGFVGLYLAPAPNRPASPWMPAAHPAGIATLLREQGWSLLPIYVGRQQNGANFMYISSDEAAAATQGTRDGAGAPTAQGRQSATTLAHRAGLSHHATLILDMEPCQVTLGGTDVFKVEKSTMKYMNAWVRAVTDAGYGAGVYCNRGNADAIHAGLTHPDTPIWVDGGPNRPLLDPLDQANLNPVGMPNPHQWAFAAYAQAWQFENNNTERVPLYLDTGIRRDWTAMPDTARDFDVATVSEPGIVGGGHRKAARRKSVRAISGPTSLKSGGSADLTVTLNSPAGSPNGQLVLLRCDRPELIVPTSLTVAAGSTTGSVKVIASIVSSSLKASVTARSLRQLTGPFPSTTIQIST
jgi:hypothetical protein